MERGRISPAVPATLFAPAGVELALHRTGVPVALGSGVTAGLQLYAESPAGMMS
jgi:hypothetical protein